MEKIIWTKIDEAPALATYSLFPIVKKFIGNAGVDIEQSDISLAGRVLAQFPDRLKPEQRVEDELSKLGELVKKPEANIIKLPNISASIPQLKECIAELQSQGYDLPDFPEDPKTEEEKAIREKYAVCLGSAVNPVLREGNSDRRAAPAVKRYAQKHPHKLKPFAPDCKAYVAHMEKGDFYESEQSFIAEKEGDYTIELNGKVIKTIENVEKNEIISAANMSAKELSSFLAKTVEDAKEKDLLWSIHLKATMMKVSDPIMFGHAVKVFFKELFDKYADEFEKLGVNPDLGIGDLLKKIEKSDKKDEIKADIERIIKEGKPNIAMVDSDNLITNLHFSNDIIIDASMPPVIREGGKMWNKDGELQECVCVIPDRSYATMYSEILEDCKTNGQFDVATMGHVSNVGLMAKKAEEYGSHPYTFRVPEDGVIEVKDPDGEVKMRFEVEKGDIWRAYRVKDVALKDWVRLAVERARLTGNPAVFWLDEKRAHDRDIINQVKKYLPEFDTEGLTIEILAPKEAMAYTLARTRKGLDTISVTGNVLRDYLTDLFPILELGTSAKMMSIVPLLAGGGLFETGAGGSAPKHVDQFLKEGHLRWDSLGEFLALAESLRMIYNKTGDKKVKAVLDALDKANEAYLDNDKAPSRKCCEPDNKASHFYLAKYWAEALANSEDKELAEKFEKVAKELNENEQKIVEELLAIEGKPQDIGGYYHPDDAKAEAAMRPSKTLNQIIDSI
ncbi:MAG: NADP-dependent isocitrate dehydrogenase [Epsilonproteobacteria bacterium]|nr:NADP-dependent isocitrate dehydrogenase [Campylobacterota bacterium]